jgi:hypothetical protein
MKTLEKTIEENLIYLIASTLDEFNSFLSKNIQMNITNFERNIYLENNLEKYSCNLITNNFYGRFISTDNIVHKLERGEHCRILYISNELFSQSNCTMHTALNMNFDNNTVIVIENYSRYKYNDFESLKNKCKQKNVPILGIENVKPY